MSQGGTCSTPQKGTGLDPPDRSFYSSLLSTQALTPLLTELQRVAGVKGSEGQEALDAWAGVLLTWKSCPTDRGFQYVQPGSCGVYLPAQEPLRHT